MEKQERPEAQEILACETALILEEKEEKREPIPADGTDFWFAVIYTILGYSFAYLLSSGKIGVIGHKCYQTGLPGEKGVSTYLNIAFVFDPETHPVLDEKILATAKSYPAHVPKKPHLVDCAFTSGIVMRPDGRADLYSGLGDTCEGRITIDNPFAGFGSIVTPAGI